MCLTLFPVSQHRPNCKLSLCTERHQQPVDSHIWRPKTRKKKTYQMTHGYVLVCGPFECIKVDFVEYFAATLIQHANEWINDMCYYERATYSLIFFCAHRLLGLCEQNEYHRQHSTRNFWILIIAKKKQPTKHVCAQADTDSVWHLNIFVR